MDTLVQQTQDWLEFRKRHVGASDAPVIMEMSPWKTPYQLWLEKLDLVPSSSKNSAMERGLQLENEARLNFTLQTGIDVSPQIAMHPNIKWMMASLDGISEDKKTIVEIKCPGKEDHSKAENGEIPEKYYPQLQHQMEVAQLDKMFYFSFHPKNGSFSIPVYKDEKFIKKLLKKEEEFYACMENFVSPSLIERDYEVIEDEVWKYDVTNWLNAKEQLEYWQELEKKRREKLTSRANGKNVKGAGIFLTKLMKKGNIDYSSIPELNGVNLEKYRKKSIDYYKISNIQSST